MPTSVFTIDRAIFRSRPGMVIAIKIYAAGGIVQVEDSNHPTTDRLRYEIRPADGTIQLLDATGHQLGTFASIDALVDHAEALTAK